MRFLIDENLSWHLAELLTKAGHDAIHVRDLDAAGAPDTDVVALAARDDRLIISADTDFGALLAHSRATKPSVILVRALVDRRPLELAGIIAANPTSSKSISTRALSPPSPGQHQGAPPPPAIGVTHVSGGFVIASKGGDHHREWAQKVADAGALAQVPGRRVPSARRGWCRTRPKWARPRPMPSWAVTRTAVHELAIAGIHGT